MAIQAIGKEKVHSGGLSKQEENKKGHQPQNVAYMGCSIGNLLNGSAQPPTDASAVRA
ncbi:MAG: hypothetical protein WCG95_02945 [bacterium]